LVDLLNQERPLIIALKINVIEGSVLKTPAIIVDANDSALDGWLHTQSR
jgi:hypothetical protein